jgi:heme/copper-type cytochrome/quinol oxidase subunit 2
MAACALLAALVLGACGSNFGASDSATEQGSDILDLWRVMIVIALVILALVLGLVVWSIVRYRARGRDEIPNQRQYPTSGSTWCRWKCCTPPCRS